MLSRILQYPQQRGTEVPSECSGVAIPKGMWTRREFRVLVALTVFAFALRSGWLLVAHPAAVSDALGYKSLAVRWIDTGQYVWSGWPGHATAFRTPGYIAFLAGGLTISRSDPWLSFLNVLAATTIVPLVAVLARRLGLSASVALLAAGLSALMPPLVLWAVVLGPENLQAPLLLAALVLAADPRRLRRTAIWSGVVFGAAILVRPESLVYLPVVTLVLVPAPWHVVGRRTVIIAAVALALCVPWVVRNEVQVGPVGLSSVGGLNFYLAHRADGYGFAYDTPLAGLDEVSMSRSGYALGIEHLRKEPLGLLGDVAVGTRRLYEPPRYAAVFSTRSFARIAPYPRSVSASLLSDVRTVDQDGWYVIAGLAVAGWILLIVNRRRAALVVTGLQPPTGSASRSCSGPFLATASRSNHSSASPPPSQSTR